MTANSPDKPKPAHGKTQVEYSNNLEDTRLFVALIVNLLHHLDQSRRGIYENDLDMASVAGAVSTQSSVMRPAEFREKFRDVRTIIGVEGQQGINALSLSQFTGIPRETVRRKLKRLTELGAIVEKSRGSYVMKPGFAQKPESIALYHESMRVALQFINDCFSMGLIKVTDK